MEGEINADFLFDLKKNGSKSVIDWCMNAGLIVSSYKCYKCGRRMKLSERKDVFDGCEWLCRTYGVHGHEVKRSVREGSWFSESKLGIIEILLITYYWVNKLPIDFITKDLRLNNDAVIEWINFCREICMEICIHESSVLGGKGVTIELLKSKTGIRKMIKIKGDKRDCILAGIENGSNKLFFRLVECISKEILLDTIKTYVLPGTTIVSECWKAYDSIKDDEFLDSISSQSLCLKNSDTCLSSSNNTDVSLAIIEQNHNQLTEKVPASEISNSFIDRLDLCLGEIIWRRSHNNEETMEGFLEALLKVYPPKKED